MISDKMQMIQLCNVQASFMLASLAAFSVSMGHCALVCLWYTEMPWQSRQQHFTFWVREGKEKRVTSSCLSHRTSGLLQRRCQMPSAYPCWSTSFKLMNTAFFWKTSPLAPWYTFEGVWALMAAVYLHICHSIHIKTTAVKYAGISQTWKVFYKPISYADSNVIALKCYYKCACCCQHLHYCFKGN